MKAYLAHPFDTRQQMRQWELATEVKFDIEIINPFYDITRADVDPIDSGQAGRYELLDPKTLVERDIAAIMSCDAVIAYIDGSLSYGTIMEIVYAHLLRKPVYLVVTNGHDKHPWLVRHAQVVYTTLEDLEEVFI